MNVVHGLIDQSSLGRKNDYLYRLSLKALIVNENDEVLVVKESGRTWWDLPGGGMDHDESVKNALARELHEEVGLNGDFTYQVIAVDEPVFLVHANVWQVRLVFKVSPTQTNFSSGDDADDTAFIDPSAFKASKNEVEQRIHRYFTSQP